MLAELGSTREGLTSADAAERLGRAGGNELVSSRRTALSVLVGLAAGGCHGRPAVDARRCRPGYAVYVLSRAVRMLRLTDGRDVLLTRPATVPVHAQLQPSGVYVSSRYGVTFTTMAQVRRRFG